MSYPKVTLKGLVDESTREVPYSERPRAVHTPLVLIMAKRGPIEPVYLDIDGFDIYYSLMSLGKNSPWYGHQSPIVEVLLEASNSSLIVKRVVDDVARVASTIIGFEYDNTRFIDKTLDSYLKDVDINGFSPLFTIEADNPGEWGNYVGIEIFKAPQKIQQTIGVDTGCIVYEAIIYTEDENSGQRRPLINLFGEYSTYFTLKRDSIRNGVNYFFDDIMEASYIEEASALTRQSWIGKFKFHTENAVRLAMIERYWEKDLLNEITGLTGSGFIKGKQWMLKGGNDGFPNETGSWLDGRLDKQRRYDEAVREWLTTLTDNNELADIAKYPFSTIWDTGFTRETKMALIKAQRIRKDIWIALSAMSHFRYLEINGETYFDYMPPLSTQELISLAAYYRTIYSLNQESHEFGTPYTRGILMLQDGLNRKYGNKRASLVLDMAKKIAEYCGSSSGKWNSAKAPDEEVNNTLDGWYDVVGSYIPPVPKELAWDAGVIYAQNKNIKQMHYPAFQTLYPHDTSVLNNLFTMMAACHIQYIHHRAWQRVTGNSKHTPEELADKVDLFINTELRGVFDGRFIIEVETKQNPDDKLNGFSWTTETTIYSIMAKHSASFRIIARRQSDNTLSIGDITWR